METSNNQRELSPSQLQDKKKRSKQRRSIVNILSNLDKDNCTHCQFHKCQPYLYHTNLRQSYPFNSHKNTADKDFNKTLRGHNSVENTCKIKEKDSHSDIALSSVSVDKRELSGWITCNNPYPYTVARKSLNASKTLETKRKNVFNCHKTKYPVLSFKFFHDFSQYITHYNNEITYKIYANQNQFPSLKIPIQQRIYNQQLKSRQNNSEKKLRQNMLDHLKIETSETHPQYKLDPRYKTQSITPVKGRVGKEGLHNEIVMNCRLFKSHNVINSAGLDLTRAIDQFKKNDSDLKREQMNWGRPISSLEMKHNLMKQTPSSTKIKYGSSEKNRIIDTVKSGLRSFNMAKGTAVDIQLLKEPYNKSASPVFLQTPLFRPLDYYPMIHSNKKLGSTKYRKSTYFIASGEQLKVKDLIYPEENYKKTLIPKIISDSVFNVDSSLGQNFSLKCYQLTKKHMLHKKNHYISHSIAANNKL